MGKVGVKPLINGQGFGAKPLINGRGWCEVLIKGQGWCEALDVCVGQPVIVVVLSQGKRGGARSNHLL